MTAEQMRAIDATSPFVSDGWEIALWNVLRARTIFLVWGATKLESVGMMEVVPGYAPDVVALVWHDKLGDDDVRALMTVGERDARAGKHDMRLFAKLTAFGDHKRPDDSGPPDQWPNVGRIAIVTDDPVSRHVVQFFAPFFHAAVKVFPNAQSSQARIWLQGRKIRP